MHKNERGDDVNIGVAERVSSTVRGSRNLVGSVGDIRTEVSTWINMDNNSIEYDSVRLSPSFMEFKDACEGMTFRQLFTIQNIGQHIAHVRICSPNSIAFQIKTLRSGVFLSPGLRIRRWVHYSYKRNSVLHTMIPVYINGKYIDYHVICTLAKASLFIEPTSLDFGLVDIGSTSGMKIVTLRNDGGRSTRFAVDLGPNEMDLSVKPMRGILQARSKMLLKVELIGVEEGSFFGEFWIKSTPNMRVPVKVNIIIPRLVVHHPNTTGDFTLVDFPLTFTNTIRHDTIILRSLSAQVSNFVVLGEIDNDLIPFKHINLDKHPAFKVFTIYPLEGRMDPFEGRVFNITFSPTVKVIKGTEEFRKRDRQDFMIFVRIFRVHCTELEDIVRKEMSLDDRTEEPLNKVQLLQPDSAESLETVDIEPPESPGYETVRLCLYGETEEARLEFVPNELNLGDLAIGELVQRELTMKNPSYSSSIFYKFLSNPGAHCKPSSGRIEPHKSIQVLITVIGNYNVKVPFKLTFNVLIQTCDLTSLKVSHTAAKPCWVLGWYKLIIPLVEDKGQKTNSSGQSNEVAAHGVSDDGVSNKISEKKNPGANLPLVKNIDLGRYALSPSEEAFKSHHRLHWSNYIRSRRSRREKAASKLSNAVSSVMTDCKDLLVGKLPQIKEQSMAQKMFNEASASKVVNKAKDEILVPLSPLQIYNVKISPTILAYGLVAPKSTNYHSLHVENLNDFPVMLRLVSRVSRAINFQRGSLIVLQSGSQITKIVEYRAQQIGKFNTYIDYVINDNHSFAMTVTATVVPKSLNLNVREIIFGKQCIPREAYQPLASIVEIKNKLDAATSFTWDLRSNTNFVIYPMSGEVRGNRSLFAEVRCEPNVKSNNTEAILTSDSGTWTNLKLSAQFKMPDVAFINDTLDLDKIPLNMITTTVGVIHNAEYNEVMFQIDQSSLIHGCEVFPHRGIISPRGIANLEVRLRFDACVKFSITIDVLVQNSLKLGLKLFGEVAFPVLKFSPETISIKRISADAFVTHFLTASNTGKTIVKAQFPLDEYPEYRASLSLRRKDPCIDSEGVMILPGASVSIYLHFIPIELASYSFYLPVIINEILGPALIESPKTLNPRDFLKGRETYYANCPGTTITELPSAMSTVFIDCTVCGHVISFSDYIFHFDVMSNKVKDKLRIFNETHQEVSFIIRTDDFSDRRNPFSMTWVSGVAPTITTLAIVCTLQPGEEIIFLIEFRPTELGTFEIEAPIFVRGELEGNMFSSLLLDGINLVSCIRCDKTEIFFAPVSLGVEAEQKFTLKVGRCQSPFEIQTVVVKPDKCVGNYTDDSIQAKFIGGNLVTGKKSNEELDIVVLFRSQLPVAFATRIDFHVSDAVVCSVKVYCIADNCILTTYGFLRGSPELPGMCKQLERISSPSITSRGEGSSSLTRQELIIPRRQGETVLKRYSIYPRVSGVGQKLMKNFQAEWKIDQNEDEKSEGYDDDDIEGISLRSRVSGNLHPASEQYSKLSTPVYPYFPTITKSSEADHHMQRTLAAAEQWMYSTGFNFNFYPSIVDGITAVLSGVCSATSGSSEKRKAHTVGDSFIDLLASLAGRDVILKYIGDHSRMPENSVERVTQVLKLYDNVIEFLKVQGGFLPHVHPQFLLSYDDYLINHMQHESLSTNYPSLNNKNSTKLEMMSEEMFQSRSKQCWLDVSLQTFRTLVLSRINIRNQQDDITASSSQCDSYDSTSVSTALSGLDYLAKKTSVTEKNQENAEEFARYTNEETLLLNWLQFHFDQQRIEGWMRDDRTYLNPQEYRDVLQSRIISNFENDLADGLPLIAVTAAHCPYLIQDHFNNIFISPRSAEEFHHNAVCLTSAWRKIRLGFIIAPNQIIRPNCVQMLILVTHLFQNLPSYLPKAKIQFCCPLTETITRQISLSNGSEYPVSYVVQFIGNETNLFTAVATQPIVNLEARNAGSFKIQYHARKIARTTAHVILCGSSIAPNFAQNQVFVLEGCTSQLAITNNYDIEGMLYKVCDQTLSIPVPYKEVAEYDISMTEDQPTVPASLKMSRWVDLKTRKVPRRLFLNQKSIAVSENSYRSDLSITVACIAPTRRSFWIIFESEIGDFIIQINSTSKKSTTDHIAAEWERDTCVCSDLPDQISSSCPLNIRIAIPSRNIQLWNCINVMFQKTLDQKECLFWSRHIDTNIGLRLIHWLMGDYHDLAAKEFIHIFNTSVTYNVTTSDTEYLNLPAKLSIPDVRPRDEEVSMPVHILQATPQAYATTIRLTSPDVMEYRTYKIDLLCKTPIPPLVTSETNNRTKKKNKRR